MSKESNDVSLCTGCGNYFTFLEQHMPHCQGVLASAPLPKGLQAIADGLAAAGRAMGHAPELAKRAAEATVLGISPVGGGLKDQPVGKRRAGKSNTAKKKQPRKGGRTQ